jgi:hypothetical protein
MDSGDARPPLKLLRVFSVPKREDTPNEDRHCVSQDGSIYAISDGASVSYDPGPWAEILCRRFTENPDVSKEWIDAAALEYQAAYDREAMSWSQEASFDRGSSATLLGVVCSPDRQSIRVFSFGDSLLAFVVGGSVVTTIPYASPAEFDRAPILFSTNLSENRSLDEEAFAKSWHDLTIASHEAPILLLMTDAIGRWLLDQPEPSRISTLLEISDSDSFAQFVTRGRSDGRLHRDDTTLIVIG